MSWHIHSDMNFDECVDTDNPESAYEFIDSVVGRKIIRESIHANYEEMFEQWLEDMAREYFVTSDWDDDWWDAWRDIIYEII